VGPRKMVRLQWFMRQKVLRPNIHGTEGLLKRNIAVVLILLEREKSRRERVCSIDIIWERKEQETVCVLY